VGSTLVVGLWDGPYKSPADAGGGLGLEAWCRIGAINVSLPAIQWLACWLGWGLPDGAPLAVALGWLPRASSSAG
jgi:hypothetical protein